MNKKTSLTIGVIALVSTAGIVYSAYAYQGDPGKQGPNFSSERHEQMQKAFESNDYNVWKSLMNGRGQVSEVINEGNFARFSEMHQLMLAGKYDDANKIREELGLRARNSGQAGGQNENQGQRKGNGNCNL